MPMKLYLGDIVQTRKKHPCGSDHWKILRVGMDFRLECCNCGHQIWLPRPKLEKSIKRIIESHAPETEATNTAD